MSWEKVNEERREKAVIKVKGVPAVKGAGAIERRITAKVGK